MSRSFATRAAIVLMALLLPLTGICGPAPASCCVDDCAQPCCERDVDHGSVVPVLPCCRTVGAERAAPQPTPTTLDHEHPPCAAPALLATPLTAVVWLLASLAPPIARTMAAPPLYHRHCALLL